MIETMRAANGAGLAANQVAETVRIAVVEVTEGNPRYPYKPPIPLTVIVNPRSSRSTTSSCRSTRAACRCRTCAARSPPFEHPVCLPGPRRRGARGDPPGLTAGTFQHELDHLDGTLFVDGVRDPRTFSTWEQFERFKRDAFVDRARKIVEVRLVSRYWCEPGSRRACRGERGDRRPRVIAASRAASRPRPATRRDSTG